MDDPSVTKSLRNKEKVQFMIDGMMDTSQTTTLAQKRVDIPCLVFLVTSQDSANHYAIVFILKKNKKIDVMLPLTAELQILDLDSLNFVVYWDPLSYDQLTPNTSNQVPSSATLKVRVICNHAGDKKTFLERISNVK